MHESAMAMSMVRLMEQAAQGTHARRVARVRLRVGELCAIDPRVLESAFASASRGTVAEGCVLEIHPVPAVLRCSSCWAAHGGPPNSVCPACGEPGGEVVEGRESWIESLDVDVEPSPAPLGGAAV